VLTVYSTSLTEAETIDLQYIEGCGPDLIGDTPYSLLTAWSRVLLEKLTGFQLVKKFPPFYGTRRFITAVTSARHLSLSCLFGDNIPEICLLRMGKITTGFIEC
jgi:hypothetical protein